MPNLQRVAIPSTTGPVLATGCGYYGFSLYNTHATNLASVMLYDGDGAVGAPFETITFAGNESVRENGPNPIRVTAIYAVVTGTVAGTVRYA